MTAIVREVTIGDCRLILGDCLQVMQELGPVDAVVTDPPYGVLDEEWDDMDAHELAAFTMQWVGAVRQISSTATIFFGEKTRQTISEILHIVYPKVRQMIWSKGGGSVADDGMFYSYESAYLCRSAAEPVVIVGPKQTSFGAKLKAARMAAGLSRGAVDFLAVGKKTGLCYRWEEGACLPSDTHVESFSRVMALDAGFYAELTAARAECAGNVTANQQRTKDAAAKRLDLFRFPSPTGIGHPTSKPVGLMMELCEVTGGATILDPFMGSGSTLVACVKLGRAAIGIERRPDYFDIACERVRKAYDQPDLFIAPPKSAPVQETLL